MSLTHHKENETTRHWIWNRIVADFHDISLTGNSVARGTVAVITAFLLAALMTLPRGPIAPASPAVARTSSIRERLGCHQVRICPD